MGSSRIDARHARGAVISTRDFLRPGEKDVVRRDGDLFEAGALESGRGPLGELAIARGTRHVRLVGRGTGARRGCGRPTATPESVVRDSACADAPDRVKPREPASGRCQAAVSRAAVAATASATPRRIGLVTSSGP